VLSNAPRGVHVQCTLSFFSGSWDAVAVPASQFLTIPLLRKLPCPVLAYGASHLFRVTWLAGVWDYLREPWETEELFLRLRGFQPSFASWCWGGSKLTLDGLVLGSENGLTVCLTPAEADILRLLVARQGLAVSRAILALAGSVSEGRVVDTLIGRLRNKLKTVTNNTENPLTVVRGVGYRLP